MLITSKVPKPKASVLVLNTAHSMNRPLITDATGSVNTNFLFLYGEGTEAHLSCSITWQNQMYVFGGGDETLEIPNRQISKIIGCELKRVGTLEFNLMRGGCTNYKDDRVFLCFDMNQGKTCYTADGPESPFTSIESSNYDHRITSLASSESEYIS